MNKILRNMDVINGLDDLEKLHHFDDFPVFMGCTQASADEDVFSNMQWNISKGSGMIQLNPLLPLDLLYAESHGSGDIGALWSEHHKQFAKFINTYGPESVLEIGGGHGILSYEYEKFSTIDWTIIEPNPSPSKDLKAKFIKGFFDDKFEFDANVDTVVHSHVLEHVYEPNIFLSHLSGFLKEGQKAIFSLPNMEVMLKRNYTNCINFEHTVFMTEPYVEHLMSKHGFRQLDKLYFKEDHSIFYAYVKDSNVSEINLSVDLYSHNKSLYIEYISYHKKIIFDINKKIAGFDKDKSIYLFGAHVFSQYLIAFGLNTDQIVSVLDNDPKKQEKRLYGTDLKVESPQVLSSQISPIVIIKAGVYDQEIKDDILGNINQNVYFIG
ncbi:class I SAM-dependent methyltransferase [Alphaproteobacteria bacterium]|nr:class I SAM-dependent methyltransferase [Alphaproteobacteria bacterium]